MRKARKRERSIAAKLVETKQGKEVLRKELCPNCLEYTSWGGDLRYRCTLLGYKREYGGISFTLSSTAPCTIDEAINCVLKGTSRNWPKERGIHG